MRQNAVEVVRLHSEFNQFIAAFIFELHFADITDLAGALRRLLSESRARQHADGGADKNELRKTREDMGQCCLLWDNTPHQTRSRTRGLKFLCLANGKF